MPIELVTGLGVRASQSREALGLAAVAASGSAGDIQETPEKKIMTDLEREKLSGLPHVDALEAALEEKAGTADVAMAVESHAMRDDNPHSVTKEQIGLGSVDDVPASELRDRSTHTGVQAMDTIDGLVASISALIPQSAIGAVNGVAPLGSDGKVPSVNLPADGAYKGTWNAATNSPTIVSGVGITGDFYFVSVAGSTSIDGVNAWNTGDQLRFNGSVWQRIPSSTAVVSVAGKAGVVALEVGDIDGLAGALSGKQAALGYAPVNKAGDAMDGPLTLPASGLKVSGASGLARIINFLTSGFSRWILHATSGAESGSNAGSDFAINAYSDAGSLLSTPFRIIRATGEVLFGTSTAVTTALGGMVTTKAVTLASGTDIDTVYFSGEYRVEAAVNGPFALGSGQHVYLKVISFTGAASYFLQELYVVNPGYGRPAKWVRRCHNSVLTAWSPAEGVVTPAHYGGRPFPTPIASGISGTDDTAAVQRWLDSPWPKVLDGWYRITASVSTTLDSARNGLSIKGSGADTGIRMDSGATVTIAGADLSNPYGTKFDTVTLRDFSVLVNSSVGDVILSILFANGDSGSPLPGLHMSNVHFVPAGSGTGPSDAMILLRNVREGRIENVSGEGRYGAFTGDFIRCEAAASSTPVELTFTNVRGCHFKRGFVVKRADGSVANDDIQGHHWINCTVLAVDRGWDIDGGAEGFGEWFTITNCHAFFREIGVYGPNAGNMRISGYFLGYGSKATIQGIALTGTSIVGIGMIDKTIVKLDGATGAERIGFNLPSTMSGSLAHCRSIGATNAYGLVAASWIKTDCA